MSRVIFASHGGLSKGMKDSVTMIVGDLTKNVETYSLLPGENPEDYYQELYKQANESNEQILVLCDIKGGSVHTALSKLAVLDNVVVFSGMNMGLALEWRRAARNNRKCPWRNRYDERVEQSRKWGLLKSEKIGLI